VTTRQPKPDSEAVGEQPNETAPPLSEHRVADTSGEAPAPRPRIEMLDVKPDRLRIVREISYYVIPSLLILAIWWLAIEIFDIKAYLLPYPQDVLETLWTERAQLIQEGWVTLQESLWGFGLAVAVAIPLAMLVTFSKVAERTIYPILVVTQVIPKVAIAPLLIVWMGFGISAKILLAFLVAFFAIVVNTATGLASLDIKMVHLARSMGASTWQTFVRFRLPNSLPIFFAGLKVGVTLALIGAIVGEFVASSQGLGFLTVVAMGSLNTRLVFAAIIAMAIVGVAMYAAVEALERLLIPWSRTSERSKMDGLS